MALSDSTVEAALGLTRVREVPCPCQACRMAFARDAIVWLLTRIGSWTNARWDQHLRDEYGDDAADLAIAAINGIAGTDAPSRHTPMTFVCSLEPGAVNYATQAEVLAAKPTQPCTWCGGNGFVRGYIGNRPYKEQCFRCGPTSRETQAQEAMALMAATKAAKGATIIDRAEQAVRAARRKAKRKPECPMRDKSGLHRCRRTAGHEGKCSHLGA